MARRMGRLRTQTVSANVRQEEEIQLLKDFKARCAASGASCLLYTSDAADE